MYVHACELVKGKGTGPVFQAMKLKSTAAFRLLPWSSHVLYLNKNVKCIKTCTLLTSY